MKKVLFLCVGNSCRSQMAQGRLNHLAQGKAEARSAGSEPSVVNPLAKQVMLEAGVSIEHHTSKHIDDLPVIDWDYIITVCDKQNEICPYIPGGSAIRIHHAFQDPVGKDSDVFKKVRDEIKSYVTNLLQDID